MFGGSFTAGARICRWQFYCNDDDISVIVEVVDVVDVVVCVVVLVVVVILE